MEWRTWAHNQLKTDPAVNEAVGGRIIGAGSTNVPGTPFIQLMFGPPLPRLGGAVEQAELLVWVHDRPGGYTEIDRILKLCKAALVGDLTDDGALTVEWQGESNDLADDGFDTITRNGSFLLLERSVT